MEECVLKQIKDTMMPMAEEYSAHFLVKQEQGGALAKDLSMKLYVDKTMSMLEKAKAEGGHEAMVQVMKDRYPHVFAPLLEGE